MKRTWIGVLFIGHGLAHSAFGMWAASMGPAWVVTPLWWVAQVGFMGAGAGLIGVAGWRRIWAPLAFAAGVSSIVLLSLYGVLGFMLGLLLDAAIIVVGLQWGEPAAIARIRRRHAPPDTHPRRHARTAVLAGVALAYVSATILLRPWQLTWGTTRDDRTAALPGDRQVPDARYRMDRAVVIRAPAEAVWPWLVQLGQDRAGFYSYDRLERLFGADIHNTDRIHPEWQTLREGDLVRAVQSDYLGGRFGSELGWRVVELVPGRALVLERWGAFVVRPVDRVTTKLQIRLREELTPALTASVLAPISLLAFEPAHFIMERGMLLGIKARAERTTSHPTASTVSRSR